MLRIRSVGNNSLPLSGKKIGFPFLPRWNIFVLFVVISRATINKAWLS